MSLDQVIRLATGCVLIALAATGLAAQQGNALYGPKGISPEAVRQGYSGTCYFHASIASLARAHSDLIRNAIKEQWRGSYQVQFASGPAETVFPEDVAFGRDHRLDFSEGTWVLVLERAYAQRVVRQSLLTAVQSSRVIPGMAKPSVQTLLNHSGLLLVAWDRAIRSVVNEQGYIDKGAMKVRLTEEMTKARVPALEAGMVIRLLDEAGFFEGLEQAVRNNGEVFGAFKAIGQGGNPAEVLAAFAGRADGRPTAVDQQLRNVLQQAHTGSAAVVAWTKSSPSKVDFPVANTNWWIAGHAFSVLDYDSWTETVHLRNPWGNHPDPDGQFALPLQAFVSAYEGYEFTEPNR